MLLLALVVAEVVLVEVDVRKGGVVCSVSLAVSVVGFISVLVFAATGSSTSFAMVVVLVNDAVTGG